MAKPKVLVEPDVEAGSRLAALLLEAANKMPHGGSSGGDEVRWEARNKILPRGRQHASAVHANRARRRRWRTLPTPHACAHANRARNSRAAGIP